MLLLVSSGQYPLSSDFLRQNQTWQLAPHLVHIGAMKLVSLFSLACLVTLRGVIASERAPASTAPDNKPELVVVAYSTYAPDDAMLWGSAQAHSSKTQEETKMVAVGQGIKLFDDPPRHTRGWMYRFRQVVKGIMAEYDARDRQDFLVVVGDAFDTYVTKSSNDNTMDLIKDRFLHDFGNSSIVFSSQIYCCNPWNLHEVGRAAWDEHYDAVGGPETIYKHLNAGMFMGYASAIIDMAHDLNVFETKYQRHETFDEILATKGASNIHMFDVDVDDDEWQLSIWYLKEKRKASPRATLDVHQHLFTTTGTFRAANRDGGFTVFSQEDFYSMIGTLPVDFEEDQLDDVTLCPYSFDSVSQSWMNTITQSHPLAFHFAGNEWVCACNIMTHDHFEGPNKFKDLCPKEAPFWYGHVNEGIKDISLSSDPNEYVFLKVVPKDETAAARELNGDSDDERRQLKKSRPGRSKKRPSPRSYGKPRQLSDYDDEKDNASEQRDDARQLKKWRPLRKQKRPTSGYGGMRLLKKGRPVLKKRPSSSGYGKPRLLSALNDEEDNASEESDDARQLKKGRPLRKQKRPASGYGGKRELKKGRPILIKKRPSPSGYGKPRQLSIYNDQEDNAGDDTRQLKKGRPLRKQKRPTSGYGGMRLLKKGRPVIIKKRPSSSGYGKPRQLSDYNDQEDNASEQIDDARQLKKGRPLRKQKRPTSGYGGMRLLKKGRPVLIKKRPSPSGYGKPRQLSDYNEEEDSVSENSDDARQLKKGRPLRKQKRPTSGYGSMRQLTKIHNDDEGSGDQGGNDDDSQSQEWHTVAQGTSGSGEELQSWSDKYDVVQYWYTDE
jgi:hypothetical protein